MSKTLFDLPEVATQQPGDGLLLRPCAKSLTLPDRWYAEYQHAWSNGNRTGFVSTDPCPVTASAPPTV